MEPEFVRVQAPGMQYHRHQTRTAFHNALKDYLQESGILSYEAGDEEIDECIYEKKYIVELAVFYNVVISSNCAANNGIVSKQIKLKRTYTKVAALHWTV